MKLTWTDEILNGGDETTWIDFKMAEMKTKWIEI